MQNAIIAGAWIVRVAYSAASQISLGHQICLVTF